jgi:hypothetical protein
MQPCPAEEVILSFVEDRLRLPERESLEEHLSGCASCGALVAAVANAWYAEGRLEPPARPEPEFSSNQQVGPYRILALAGRGSMGVVYRARDPRLGRDVALKTLPRRFAEDPQRLARFRLEMRVAGGIAHPNTVTVFDVGTHEGTPYFVTEWLEGGTLRARLAAGPLSTEQTVRLGAQLARGLAAAHERQVIHRDLSPVNVFLCGDGSCKILDFGLARLAAETDEEVRDPATTQPGVLLGTAGYMAPEQVLGHPADHRSDLFALGAVLYEMATGRPAFPGESPVERMSATLRHEPIPIPGELGALIARCLAKDPKDRFQSTSDLAFHLAALAARSEPALAVATPSPAAALSTHRPGLGGRSRGSLLALGLGCVAVAAAAGALLLRGGRVPALVSADRPSYQPLTFDRGHVLSARFSPDGHTVVYGAAWNGEAPQLYSARTDQVGATELGVNADVLGISSRGEMAVLLGAHFLDSDFGLGTLARMPLTGGAPRSVLEKVYEADWNPDGQQLAIVREVGRRFRLESPPGTVRFETEGRISHARVAPGGDRLAFLLHPNPKDDAGAVMVLEGTGFPRELSGGWSSTRGLAWWTPPGAPPEVWFTATRSGADYDLHAVDLSGRLRLVDRVAGRLVLQDIARSGQVLLDQQSIRTGLMVGSDRGDERDIGWTDASFLTDLAADGRTVLFADGVAAQGTDYGVYVRTVDRRPPVRLGEGFPLALSPDGAWAVIYRQGPPRTLSLTPTGPGASRPLPLGELEVVLGGRFFPDGRRLLLRGSAPGKEPRLWIHGLGSSAPQPITEEGTDPVVAISPDGQKLAGIDSGGALRLWTAEGKPIAQVPGKYPDQGVVSWTQDGRALHLRTRTIPVQISRVAVDSGDATPLFSLPLAGGRTGLVSIMTLFLSADGRRFAYSDNEKLSRLYLVDGLARAHPER